MEQLSLFNQPIPVVEPAHIPEPEVVTLTPISVVAKLLGVGTNRFFARLRADHILGRDNLPMQRYLNAGYFKVAKHEHSWPGSSQKSYSFTSKATDKGVDFLIERYKGEI